MFREPRVLIIGAGAAGIAAASRLLEKGLQNLTILEAEDRIGGRVHSVEFSDNVIELGAQWVHGERGNVVFDIASPYKLLDSSRNLHDFTKHVFADAQGRIVPQEQSVELLKLYHEIYDRAPEEVKNFQGSLGEYFTNEYYKALKGRPFAENERAEQFLDWMQKFENSIECSDSWFETSARGIAEYWECEGDPLLNWKDQGYRTLFDLIIRKFPGLNKQLPVLEKIAFNKEVSSIDYRNSNEVIVKTKDGSEYTAAHVIFTGSLGVLKEQHTTLFEPSLSELKQRTIKGLNIGTANKIFLEFPYRWWPEHSAGFSLIWSKEDKEEFLRSFGKDSQWLCDVFQFFTVDYQSRVLCGWVVGPSARFMETLSNNDVLDALYQLLEKFLGRSYNIPRPENIVRSRWHSNNHFRGSYSFRSTQSEKCNVWSRDLAEPITNSHGKPVIMFAGEATHEHYYSTVHGAVETGFREANRLLEYHRPLGWSRQDTSKEEEVVELDRIKAKRMQDSQWQPTETTRVVIVGAGIAGLAAAKALEAEDFEDYVLLEAQDKVGGRINSIPWNNGWIECGAQWLHGDKSDLAELCKRYELLSDSTTDEGQGLYLRDDGNRMDQRLVKEVDDVVRYALEECEVYGNLEVNHSHVENIGRVLRSRLRRYLRVKAEPTAIRDMREELFDWNVRFLMIDNSCFTLDELSVKYWGKYKWVGGQDHVGFKAGYNSLTQFISEGLNQKNVRLSSPVETIEWRQCINRDDVNQANMKPVIVTLSDKRQIFADCVIVTCSLGYLKENHKKMFDPPLPLHLSQGIDSLGFGLINKIFLDFGEPWWGPETKGFQMVWSKNCQRIFSREKLATWTRDLTGFDILEGHRAVLLGWVGGRGAHVVEMLSEQQVADDCVNLLRFFVKREDIPVPRRCKRTQWKGNKYIRGAYSHISTNCDASGISPATLAKPVWATVTHKRQDKCVPVIMLAGEATHDNYYSTTHGAFCTGTKQAETFLRHHAIN